MISQPGMSQFCAGVPNRLRSRTSGPKGHIDCGGIVDGLKAHPYQPIAYRGDESVYV